jgi:hypothetical protein
MLFDAFEWPALSSPINPDVYVRSYAVSSSFSTRDLPAAARAIVQQGGSSDHFEPIRTVTLPAGRAARVRGTVKLDPSYHGAATGITTYLLLNRHRIYVLTFRIDSRYAKRYARLFSDIAHRFRFL